jgi:DNA-binding LacI/PurR family transcriptional regulator
MDENKTTRKDSRVDEVAQWLTDEIARLPEGAKLPTVRELCQTCEASLATVSAALKLLEERRLLVRRQGSGIFVAPGARQKRLVLLANPDFLHAQGGSPFWHQLYREIERRVVESGAAFELHFLRAAPETGSKTPYLSESLTEELLDRRIHGVFSVGIPVALTRWIDRQGVATVAFADAGPWIVEMSSDVVIRQAVLDLAGRGCKRLGLWTGYVTGHPHNAGYEAERRASFQNALAEVGLAYSPERICGWEEQLSQTGELLGEQGRYLARRWCDTPEESRPDGIVSLDDILTQSALLFLLSRSFVPGKDLKIATQSNASSPTLADWEDRLTCLEYDVKDTVDCMLQLLDGQRTGALPANLHTNDHDHILRIAPRLKPATR